MYCDGDDDVMAMIILWTGFFALENIYNNAGKKMFVIEKFTTTIIAM